MAQDAGVLHTLFLKCFTAPENRALSQMCMHTARNECLETATIWAMPASEGTSRFHTVLDA